MKCLHIIGKSMKSKKIGLLQGILAKSRCHLIGKRSSNNHTIRLSRARPEDNTESVKIITSSSSMHHFNGTASQPKCHGPNGTTTSPVHQIVDLRDHILSRLRYPRRRWRGRRRCASVRGRSGGRGLLRERRKSRVDWTLIKRRRLC